MASKLDVEASWKGRGKVRVGTRRRLHCARPESVARPTFHGRPARKPFPSDDIGDVGIFGGDLHVRRAACRRNAPKKQRCPSAPECRSFPAFAFAQPKLLQAAPQKHEGGRPEERRKLGEEASSGWHSACTHAVPGCPAVPPNAVLPEATSKCVVWAASVTWIALAWHRDLCR